MQRADMLEAVEPFLRACIERGGMKRVTNTSLNPPCPENCFSLFF